MEKAILTTVLLGTVAFLLLLIVLLLVLANYQKRKAKNEKNIAQMQAKFHEDLGRAQLEIREETLRHISQELHDNISQQLGLVKLQLYHAERMTPGLLLEEPKSNITQALEDIRLLSKSLHPDRIGKVPLSESVKYEIERIKKASGVNIGFKQEPDLPEIDPEKQIFLFRIFQELLNNSLRHANATEISINLGFNNNEMTLSITDNGIGLPPNYSKGIGHTSISNRVALLGGDWRLNNMPGKGLEAVISIFIPRSPR
jgi:two-component system, NarL family, sensor kinase